MLGDLSQSKSKPHKTVDSDTPINNTNIHITNYTQNTHIHTTETHILIENQDKQRINESKEDKHNQRRIDSKFKKYWKLADKELKENKDKQWSLA